MLEPAVTESGANIATSATVGVVLLFLTGPLRFLPLCVLGAMSHRRHSE